MGRKKKFPQAEKVAECLERCIIALKGISSGILCRISMILWDMETGEGTGLDGTGCQGVF